MAVILNQGDFPRPWHSTEIRLANEEERWLEVTAAEIRVPQVSRNVSVFVYFGCVFWTRGGSGTTLEAARPNKPSWIGVPETGQLRRLRPFPPLLRISRVGHVRGCLVEQTGQLRSIPPGGRAIRASTGT
jgi:hypothetical protein